MMRTACFTFAAVVFAAGAALADSVTGQYLEVRNAEMWTGPCTQNAQMGLVGDKAILAFRVERGSLHGVRLDGLAVAAVVYGDKTFGMGEPVRTKTVFVLDNRANEAQRHALMELARRLADGVIQEVVAVRTADLQLEIDHARHSGYARLEAGIAQVRTRRMYPSDHTCQSERMAYPVLAHVQDEYGAYALVSRYQGAEFKSRFDHSNTCSAVIARFSL